MNLFSPNSEDLGKSSFEVKKFPDGDSYVRIIEKCSGKVRLFHRLYPNQNEALIEALFMRAAMKDAEEVELVAPYLPYSRQDKIWKEGEIKSIEVILKMLKSAGFSKIITFDCHFIKKPGKFKYYGLEIENYTLAPKLIEKVKEEIGEGEVISPDQGATYMSGGKGMVKVRGDYKENSEETYREIAEMKVDFEVKDKNFIIIDDMISTGSTMVKAIQNLKRLGAKKIGVAATHGFFLKDSKERLKQLADCIVVSNTIPSEFSKVNFAEMLE